MGTHRSTVFVSGGNAEISQLKFNRRFRTLGSSADAALAHAANMTINGNRKESKRVIVQPSFWNVSGRAKAVSTPTT
jgi:hypothetical protein